jgi:hypothetical protein
MMTIRTGRAVSLACLSLVLLAACSSGPAPKSTASTSATSAPKTVPTRQHSAAIGKHAAAPGGVPSCQSVQAAFVQANVAVSAVIDSTESVQRAASYGTLPYKILRHCKVMVPGGPAPSEVEIDGPTTLGVLTSLLSVSGGNCPELPTAQGYGDHGFVCPEPGSFYGIVGTTLVHVGPRFSVPDVEHVAKNIIATMR